MADERSVSVDEPKDTRAPVERRPLIAAAASRLSPLQVAWKRYVDHSLHQCSVCRRADGSPCETAEALYAAYQTLGNAGLDQMSGKTSLPQRQ